MSNANTKLRNLYATPMTLPMPYKGILYGPQDVAFLADSPATVIANLGGVAAIKGIFDVSAIPAGQTIPVSYHDNSKPTSSGIGGDSVTDYYVAGRNKGPVVDGTNPPTFAMIDFIDQATGLRKHVFVTGGTLTVS